MLNTAKNPYHTNRKESSIYTPKFIIDFLYEIIPDKYLKFVLDPACGDGRLLRGAANLGIDIEVKVETEDTYWRFEKHDFFDPKISTANVLSPSDPTLVITNPPFNQKENKKDLLPEKFLRRIFELWGEKIPVVLFTPLGLRANQRINSTRWRWMRDHVNISSIIALPLDVFTPPKVMAEYKEIMKEVQQNDSPDTHKEILMELKALRREMGVIEFHTEILCINMPELKPHYFLSKTTLP